MNFFKYFENFELEINFSRVNICCGLFKLNVDFENKTAEFVWIN